MLVNQENPWTIEKWHIRAAFRRSGIWVPDHAIKMSDRPISGPNLELEKKHFLVTVTVKQCSFICNSTTIVMLSLSLLD